MVHSNVMLNMEFKMLSPKKTIVRFPYVQRATGMSRASCYREMQRDPEFPKRIKLGERAVGFDMDEVDQYVAQIIERGSIQS